MDLDLSVDEEFGVTMTYFLNKIVSDFPETIKGRVTTPSAEHLLKVRECANRKILGKYWATAFHHSVTQLLLSTPHVRKNIQIDVALLTTRVRIPIKDDWRKLQ